MSDPTTDLVCFACLGDGCETCDGTGNDLQGRPSSNGQPDDPGPQPPDVPEDRDSGVRTVPPPSDPLAVARAFVADRYAHSTGPLLVHHRGAFHRYTGSHWPEDDDAGIRSNLYHWLEHATYRAGDETKRWQPTSPKIGNVLDALRAVAHLPAEVEPPAWIGTDGPHPADELLALANGLLHLPSRELIDHDPRLFTTHAVPFAYHHDPPEPARWLTFLEDLWGDDDESKAALQELFGYWLSGDTSQQKVGLIVGPKRSGKGTIARVATALLGRDNVAAPTLASLAGNFGLQPLLGRPLAIISDARLGHRNAETVVERLLSISGEDTITVDRKHRESWTGRLPTRFAILSNELPRLADTSGALPSRFVALILERSFYGREDPTLTDQLLGELPGILGWALDGHQRLTQRGHLTQPAASADAVRELEDLASPMGAFVRDRCHIGPEHQAAVDDLYHAWKRWCDDHGRDHPGTKQTFGRDLRAVVPGLRSTQPRDVTGHRYRAYAGIALTTDRPQPPTTLI